MLQIRPGRSSAHPWPAPAPPRVRTLMYHNVVEDRPGVRSRHHGDRYTFDRSMFAAHLDAVEAAVRATDTPVVVDLAGTTHPAPVVFSFDDGDDGNLLAAEMLEAHGWRGHFHVVSGSVGDPGHLTADEVRDLHRRGHVIGSRTATHPKRLSALTSDRQLAEWVDSVAALGAIIGEPVTVGAVPGGYHSAEVARAAAAAGLRYLFTSEPTARVTPADGCLVLGRSTIKTNTDPATAAALAIGERRAAASQALTWQLKKAAKRVGGPAYLALRRRVLGLDAPTKSDGPTAPRATGAPLNAG